MPGLVDEIGNRHSRLLVLRRNGSSHGGTAKWLCRCNCGRETTVDGRHLRSGNTKSCGCLQRDYVPFRLSEGEPAFKLLLRRIQSDARIRGYTWELTREQVRTLTKQDCYYCGIPPSQTAIYWGSEYTYNGIDRKDNNVGYVESNCVPCCKDCNLAKRTRTVQEFIAWAIRIAEKQRSRNGKNKSGIPQ